MSAVGHQTKICYIQKKVGTLPKGHDEAKRTNEIHMAIPLLDSLDIEGKVITADAMLTQRALASYLVQDQKAHYRFIVKGNQPTLLKDLQFYFQHRGEPDHVLQDHPEHGHIEIREIWVATELNTYVNFPHVQQAFMIERQVIDKNVAPRPSKPPTASPANRPNRPTPEPSF